jgi:hypothetical protein
MRTLTSAILMLLFSAPTFAGDGVQILPDASQILVSKDVGNERWSIALSLSEETPLNVTGNVFNRSGGAPSFLWCSITDVNGTADDIRNATFTWACFGSNACPAPPCGGGDQWQFVSSVSLPGRFFLP